MALRLTTIPGGRPPVISGLPTIGGVATEGLTLTAIAAAVTGTPSPTRTWQWYRGSTAISGANSNSYVLDSIDVGETMKVVQTEVNEMGTATAESAATGTVASAGGGTATIVIDDAPTIAVAPAGHMFSITLGPEFTTPAPVAPAVYNRRDHELYYYWDFGEGYTYTAPTRVFAAHRNSRYGFGSRASHVFRTPGTHTVTCLIVEPASGVSAIAIVTVTIADPATVFSTPAQTMILDTTGAGLAAYSGSAVYTTWSALISALDAATSTANEATTPRQIILRRGQTFSAGGTTLSRNGPWPTTLWRAADEAGARPILNMTGGFTWRDDNSALSGGVKGIAFQNIDFRGTWDSTTETLSAGTEPFVAFNCITAKAPKHFTFDGCRFAGFASMFVHELGMATSAGLYVNDTEVTDWQFYGIIPAGVGFLAATGSAIHQKADANAGGPKTNAVPFYNTHSGIRMGISVPLLVHSSELYSRNDWSNVSGIWGQQPNIRYDTDGVGGGYCNVQASIFEGGAVVVVHSAETPLRTNKPGNIIMEKCYLLASHMSRKLFACDKGGTTVRNNVFVVPNTPRFPGYGLVNAFSMNANATTATDPDNTAAPQRIYSNTIINLSTTPLGADEIIGFTDVFIGNNLILQPNATPALTADGPLDTTPAFTPRETGYKHNPSYGDGLFVLQTAYATPAANVWLGRPMPEAGATGTANTSQPVAWDDVFGVQRPPVPSRGALEAA